ncbi:MAG TPA: hypothetical protein DDW54_01770 [Clostridiales bacterium]|nr:hypothetical protein [Clostridiales bacterium]
MALIKCPECGETVSSAARQCVHCGYKYTVCPECGKIHGGAVSVCDVCGYAFADKTERTIGKVGSEKKSFSEYRDDDLRVLFENETPWIKFFNVKFRSVFTRIMAGVGTLLILLAPLILAFYDPQEAADKAVNAMLTGHKPFNVYNTVFSLALWGMIIDMLADSIYPELCALIYTSVFASWLDRNEIEIIPYLQAHASERGSETKSKNFGIISSAGYIQKVPTAKNPLIFKIVLTVLLSVVEVIAFQYAINMNIKAFLSAKTNQTVYSFVFSYSIIVGAVAFGVKFIADIIIDNKFINKARDWASKVAGLGALYK